MKFKVLNDLTNDGLIHYYITVFKNLFTNLDMRLVTLLIVLFCFLGAMFVMYFVNQFVSVSNRGGQMMLTGLIFILTLIVIFIVLCIYAVVIMLSNHYYGKYEADVQPVAVHNGKNDKGKWESLVTLEDKHKYKVLLSFNSKVSKQDKIHLETPNQVVKNVKPKPVDYSMSKKGLLGKDYETYHFTYKGHKAYIVKRSPYESGF